MWGRIWLGEGGEKWSKTWVGQFAEGLAWRSACVDPAVARLFSLPESSAPQLLLHTWFVHGKALHTGWCSDSLVAGVARGLSLKGWDQDGFSAFRSVVASTLVSTSHKLRYVKALWRVLMRSDTSWLEQNNLQSKIVKLNLWPLACLHIGKYIGKLRAFRDPGFLLCSQYALEENVLLLHAYVCSLVAPCWMWCLLGVCITIHIYRKSIYKSCWLS